MLAMSFAVETGVTALPALDNVENTRMDFGKHKGELITELPDSYLTWISRRRKGRFSMWAPLADKVLDERRSSRNVGLLAELRDYSSGKKDELVVVEELPNPASKKDELAVVAEEFSQLMMHAVQVPEDVSHVVQVPEDVSHVVQVPEDVSRVVQVPEEVPQPITNGRVQVVEKIHRDSAAASFSADDTERLKPLIHSFDRWGSRANTHYAQFIRWCGNVKAVTDGSFVHAHIMNSSRRNDRFLLNLLIQMYGQWGNVEEARALFDGIRRGNVFSWNTMIAAYVANEHGKEALELFRKMDLEGTKPNKLTFLAVMEACAERAFAGELKSLQKRIVDNGFGSDVFVWTSLVNLYGKCGCIDEAKRAFDRIDERDVFMWTTMIAAYAKNGHFVEALELFHEMELVGMKPNQLTFLSCLDACAGLKNLAQGAAVQATAVEEGFDSNLIIGTSIVHMFGKCGSLQDARATFERMHHKDVVSWNAIIAAYTENRHGKEALELFEDMQAQHVKPNSVTFISLLEACSLVASLGYGRFIHESIAEAGLESDVLVANSLIDMYIKCGSLEDAQVVFDKLEQRSVASFTAMISGYAHQGHAKEALWLFGQMQQSGLNPNQITFIVILFVCSHRGLVEEGWRQFVSMTLDYGIDPMKEHYNCMLDLCARSGRVDDEEELSNSIPSS